MPHGKVIIPHVTVEELTYRDTRAQEYSLITTMVRDIVFKLQTLIHTDSNYRLYMAENHPNSLQHAIYICAGTVDRTKRPLLLIIIDFTPPNQNTLWPAVLLFDNGQGMSVNNLEELQKLLVDEFQLEVLNVTDGIPNYGAVKISETNIALLEFIENVVPTKTLTDAN